MSGKPIALISALIDSVLPYVARSLVAFRLLSVPSIFPEIVARRLSRSSSG